ncbi:MAG: VOC family protein [Bacteroidia bacterium]|nr:VOC family protein [Bacteroidia bacterium]
MDSLSPNLFVKDINSSISFYKKLGFTILNQVPETDVPVWVMLQCGQVIVMLQSMESLGEDMPEINRGKGGALVLYIQIKGIRSFFENLQSQQVKILKGLEKTFYGATEFTIADPDGFVLTFAEDEV